MSQPQKKSTNGKVGDGLYDQELHAIPISDETLRSGVASPELIAEAVSYLHRDGIVVLENAIEKSHLETLEEMLIPEAEEIARNRNHHFNFGKHTRNMDQAPPVMPHLMYHDIWANPLAVSICSAILGPNPVCHYANGNTALQATGRQPVHADIDEPHPLFPFALVVNIPLHDVTVDNGATEIWIGSHRNSHIGQHDNADTEHYALTIREELVQGRRRHSPPIRACTKKGSLVIRDVRLWHAGMPNKTKKPRIMFAFVLQPKWFQAPSKVILPLKAKNIVEQWRATTGLEFAAAWVDGDVDHKKISSDDADFSTRNSKLLELKDLTLPACA